VQDFIRIRGARVHNLKNISLCIPHNQMTVITGVSGSGKSSLAFDTIYAEGQRRYVESLSAYARQFLERMEKPEVEDIDGIAPAVAIRQKNTSRNPRSTVATSTECYDFLRLLYARVGRTFCPNCGARVKRDTVDEVVARMLAEPEGSRWYALFPAIPATALNPGAVRDRPLPLVAAQTGTSAAALNAGALRDHLFDLRKKGFNRLFQGGRLFEFSTPESLLDIDFSKPLFVLVDRIAMGPGLHQRLADTVEICYREAGEVIFESASDGSQIRFNERFQCKACGREFTPPEPILFSFNSPLGACPRCQGFGNTIGFDMDRVIPDKTLSLDEGAVEPWTKPKFRAWLNHFRQSESRKPASARVPFDKPFCDLDAAQSEAVHDFVQRFFEHLETKKYKLHVRVFLSRYRGYTLCPVCKGSRLRQEALCVRVGGKNLAEVVSMNIAKAQQFFDALELTSEESAIAEKILVEIRQRLKFLNDVGLDYLTLDRLSSTLSGGEAQRIQLATCLGSRLVGACYVLDEPSIGLHSRDTGRLIRILGELRGLGNTIVVVEHDRDVMRAADHIVDLGPGAGENGGRVVFEGPLSRLVANGNGSLTARYLKGELRVSAPRARRQVNPKRVLRFTGARIHNLKNIDVEIPLAMLVAVTGVSGSGKSTLVHDVIYRSLESLRKTGDARPEVLRESIDLEEDDPSDAAPRMACRNVDGANWVSEVVMIDQSPIGRTPRSNPVTYIKAFDTIRGLFASTREAERRGYTAGHFSFNIPGGRCEVCQGDGTVTVEMQFLADVELTCEECKGTRYKSGILEIRYNGLNISEVLQLTVREAMDFFRSTPRLVDRLKVLDDVGLGYLRLGQSATTLSGGEAQRVKLAAHLMQTTSKGTLFILDEPTTGLHFDDIAKLLAALQRLIENGGSLIVIEHNLDVIRAADWVIDLGPEGGELGGRVVAQGPPEAIAAAEGSYTGRFLKAAFEQG
jgi:excinuclease ABC subunit A